MRSHLEKLLALLEHKKVILGELIDHQERFKAFLVKPNWPEFTDHTRPQELLLQKLRQVQAGQDFMMKELAASYGVAVLPNLKTLCFYVDPPTKQRINELIESIGALVTRLRGLTRLSQALNQSHWQFMREHMSRAHGRPDLGCTYTANGYTSRSAIVDGLYNSHA